MLNQWYVGICWELSVLSTNVPSRIPKSIMSDYYKKLWKIQNPNALLPFISCVVWKKTYIFCGNFSFSTSHYHSQHNSTGKKVKCKWSLWRRKRRKQGREDHIRHKRQPTHLYFRNVVSWTDRVRWGTIPLDYYVLKSQMHLWILDSVSIGSSKWGIQLNCLDN